MPFWRSHSAPAPAPVAGRHLVVGLGNPGARYDSTRHNIGFMAVEHLARRHRLSFKRSESRHRAAIATGSISGVSVALAMPVTFMNESGNAVIRMLRYYQIEPRDLLVICDDMDLPFGTGRLRPSGSAGGNNGLKSIIQSTGTDEFARLRLGIGRPRGTAIPHVLGRFPAEQEKLLPEVLDRASDAIEVALIDGVQEAMNRFNGVWVPEAEAPE